MNQIWVEIDDFVVKRRAEIVASGEIRRSELEVKAAALERQWEATLAQHRRLHDDESATEAWRSSLRAVHAERERKYLDALGRCRELMMSLDAEQDGLLNAVDSVATKVHSVCDEVVTHAATLAVRRRQLEVTSEYGSKDSSRWVAEIRRFLRLNPVIAAHLGAIVGMIDKATFDAHGFVARAIDKYTLPAAVAQSLVPDSTGQALEQFCKAALEDLGWTVRVTPATADQGVDLMANKGPATVAIQCKQYNAPVGNAAVQEVCAGRSFYGAGHAVVVSVSGFTMAATQLAQAVNVLLLDAANLSMLETRLQL
jgi:restriction system protein